MHNENQFSDQEVRAKLLEHARKLTEFGDTTRRRFDERAKEFDGLKKRYGFFSCSRGDMKPLPTCLVALVVGGLAGAFLYALLNVA